MSVPGQVFKDVLRLLNGGPDTDHPFVFIETFFERLVLPINMEFPPVDCPCEAIDELAPKDQGKRFLVKKVVIFAWNPSLCL